MPRRPQVLPLLLMLVFAGACGTAAELDDYLDAYEERGNAACMCVWDLLAQSHPTQESCYEFYDVTEERRSCVHRALGDDDDDRAAIEILHCRVKAEYDLASCYGELCDRSKEEKIAGIADCRDSYDARLQACEALPASTKETIEDCLQK